MANATVLSNHPGSQSGSNYLFFGRLPALTLVRVALLLVVFLGILYAWDGRNATMVSDGISYLDIADAIAHGHWTSTVNTYWSPLYSWALAGILIFRPAAYWEPTAVHFVNFLIYLAALACFHYFWAPLARNRPLWMIFGYAVFAWSSLQLITVAIVTPDLLLSALIYLVFGLLCRARHSGAWHFFALTGAVLGLAYLAKSVMFPLAFVFCGLVLLLPHGFRNATVVLVVFLVFALPLVAIFYHATGRWTFGDAGRITYLMYVNETAFTFLPDGQPRIGVERPLHPLKRVHDAPEVLNAPNFPFRATCPPWQSPSYWWEGAKFHFRLRAQLNQFRNAYRVYAGILLSSGALLAGLLALRLMGYAWRRPDSFSIVWSATALTALAIVHVEPRLVAPFVVLFWLWVYSGFLEAPETNADLVALVVALALLVPLFVPVPQMVFRFTRDVIKHQIASTDWQVASTLQDKGLRTGDQIAYVGDSCATYFTRLARLNVSTWIPSRDVEQFWALDSGGKRAIFSSVSATGARAVLAEQVPLRDRDDWERIGDTSVYIHLLTPMDATH